MVYFIYVSGLCIGEVSGSEAAWKAYEYACKLAEIADTDADLVDMETGEVLASTSAWWDD